ncbi:MAG TPA: hypothetical protein VF138_10130 [Caulobacteraceae bacterium]
MTRLTIMFVAGALAVAAFFAVFYLAGVALGVIAIPLVIALALAAVVFVAFKLRRS